jgi:hypothetical protein
MEPNLHSNMTVSVYVRFCRQQKKVYGVITLWAPEQFGARDLMCNN